jgi:hypothetical protein
MAARRREYIGIRCSQDGCAAGKVSHRGNGTTFATVRLPKNVFFEIEMKTNVVKKKRQGPPSPVPIEAAVIPNQKARARAARKPAVRGFFEEQMGSETPYMRKG